MSYFTARSNLVTYVFLWEKVKTVDFSETIAASDLKVGRCRHKAVVAGPAGPASAGPLFFAEYAIRCLTFFAFLDASVVLTCDLYCFVLI